MDDIEYVDMIEPSARSEIEARLSSLIREEGIRCLMAVESGSRAWGFPSPDSDYDVRFIYLRPPQDYVTLRPVRDVVERPIVDDYDVNGWDIRKTLGLLLKHNAVVAEWLDSPIRYIADDPYVAELAALADKHFNPAGYARHYASLGNNNVARWPASTETLQVKRYFYALRPALSIRSLRMFPERRPPMRLQDLMALTDLPPAIADEISDLVALKAQSRERAPARRSKRIEALILAELSKSEDIPEKPDSPSFLVEADNLFRRIVAAVPPAP
ncbi:DNA polymerase beta superfamily protein [Novosphingobium sp.]|uniref:nucleotidyltransferase domain-containing protein n=1 Tax=Novosphingobium sp. TaxID=1874826 RepID=UPI003BAC3C51